MKKVIFILTLLIISFSAGFAQVVTYSDPAPEYGCPNTTHDVELVLNNSYPVSIPANSYTLTIKIYTDLAAEFHNVVMTTTPGIPASGGATLLIEDITFQGPMTCSLSIRIDYTYPISGTYTTAASYTVQYPPTLTITENPTGTLEVQTPPADHQLLFYKDGNLEMTTTNATFTPTSSGSYTAKAEEIITGCLSENFSNALPITVTPTDVKEGQNIDVSVYPNPMVSSVTISTKLTNKLTYEISDLNGVVLKSSDFTSVTNVNVENFKAGSDVLTVRDNNQKIASYKLVK